MDLRPIRKYQYKIIQNFYAVSLNQRKAQYSSCQCYRQLYNEMQFHMLNTLRLEPRVFSLMSDWQLPHRLLDWFRAFHQSSSTAYHLSLLSTSFTRLCKNHIIQRKTTSKNEFSATEVFLGSQFYLGADCPQNIQLQSPSQYWILSQIYIFQLLFQENETSEKFRQVFHTNLGSGNQTVTSLPFQSASNDGKRNSAFVSWLKKGC